MNNTPCDIAFTRLTLKAAIQSAEILDRDAELVKEWKGALAMVPDYPIVPGSNPPIISDIEGGQPITYNVAVPVIPVFPAGEVNWWSPEAQKKIFADTIEKLSWTGYNSTMIMAGARARLSMPGTHPWITDAFKQRQMPNGYLMMLGGGYGKDYSGNFSEQVAAAGIVSEMLMQSVGGVIRVFPAWPKTLDGKFADLSAEGGFLVSAEQKDGQVVKLDITSTAGGRLQVLNPWPGKTVRINKGWLGKTVKPDAQGVITLETRPWETVSFNVK